MPPLIEPLEFIKAIHQSGVRYLLIGRQAVIAYGGPVMSMDYDIYIDGNTAIVEWDATFFSKLERGNLQNYGQRL